MTRDELLMVLLIELARELAYRTPLFAGSRREEPSAGDVVVETSLWAPDPDAIGVLQDHGLAPYPESCEQCGRAFDGSDGSTVEVPSLEGKRRSVLFGRLLGATLLCGGCAAVVPSREVWDVRPFNPHAELLDGHGTQRWENAVFVAVPALTPVLA